MTTSPRSPGTPLGLFWQPLLDDYGRASEYMWRLSDSLYFYIERLTGKAHGVDSLRYSWLLHIAGIENDEKIAARIDNLHIYLEDAGVGSTTVTTDGETLLALDRRNWFALLAWEARVIPDYAYQWWDALVDRLPLEDPKTHASFPSPPPRRVFPAIGDPDLRPIAASFAAMLRVLEPLGMNHERVPEGEVAELGRSISGSVTTPPPPYRSPSGHEQPEEPPLVPPRPWNQPIQEASTSRAAIALQAQPQRPSATPGRSHRYTWSPDATAAPGPRKLRSKRYSLQLPDARLMDVLPPEAGHFYGVESLQTIVNRGLGQRGPGTTGFPFMAVSAADEARLHWQMAVETHTATWETAIETQSPVRGTERMNTELLESEMAAKRRRSGWLGALGRSQTTSSSRDW